MTHLVFVNGGMFSSSDLDRSPSLIFPAFFCGRYRNTKQISPSEDSRFLTLTTEDIDTIFFFL